MMNLVLNTRNCALKTRNILLQNEEFCIKNDEFCIKKGTSWTGCGWCVFLYFINEDSAIENDDSSL